MSEPAPESLFAALSSGDLETVEQLLEDGATPLAVRATRESALRAAHRQLSEPNGREIFLALQRAARAASETSPNRKNGLATLPYERRYALTTERGVNDARAGVGARKSLDIVLVECDLKIAARELLKLVQSPRREADVASRPVGDAQRLTFLYRLKGIDWTILPFVFQDVSLWNVERVGELAAAGDGVATLARALSLATESRAVHLEYDELTIYSPQGGIETRAYEVFDDETDPVIELGIFVPPMNVQTDGLNVQLELFGVDPSDVERVDMLVLQEFGDPAVERTLEQRAAPPRVGGAPPPIVDRASDVDEPPLRAPDAGPMRSAPPPMVSEPPPMVSEPPPMVSEPPPIVAADAVTENEPPAVPEPAATPAGAPPMVNAPPPIVTVPVAPNDGEE